MKKVLIISAILIVLVGTASFYGGMKYQESTRQNPASALRGAGLGGQNLSPEQHQRFSQDPEGKQASYGAGKTGRGVGTGFLSGEIIAKDEQSITIKLLDGGSKIIFFSPSIEISKTAEGTTNDIEIGKQIMVSGDQNSDGSYTAKTIQIR